MCTPTLQERGTSRIYSGFTKGECMDYLGIIMLHSGFEGFGLTFFNVPAYSAGEKGPSSLFSFLSQLNPTTLTHNTGGLEDRFRATWKREFKFP